MSIAGVFATCRRSVTSCKAGAPGAAVVPLPALGSGREVGLGDQQHGVVGMGGKWGFTGTQGVCVAGEGTEVGRMWLLAPWRFWYAARTQEVWPP